VNQDVDQYSDELEQIQVNVSCCCVGGCLPLLFVKVVQAETALVWVEPTASLMETRGERGSSGAG